jgi:hypothetical protein
VLFRFSFSSIFVSFDFRSTAVSSVPPPQGRCAARDWVSGSSVLDFCFPRPNHHWLVDPGSVRCEGAAGVFLCRQAFHPAKVLAFDFLASISTAWTCSGLILEPSEQNV